MAPVVKRLEATDGIESFVCATGQHRDMLDQVLRLFGIHPDIDLDIMKNDQDLYDVTSMVLLGMRKALESVKPDIVLVQGDTTTALAAALSAYYAQITIGHVEAGLRTGKLYAPFPEEGNRALIGRIADVHFAPTAENKRNLISENISEEKIFVTGNTVIDALIMVRDEVKGLHPSIWSEQYGSALPFIMDQSRRVILVTGHRRESFGDGFLNICRALALIAERFSNVSIIYPVHLNPNVQKPVKTLLNGRHNIHLIEPLEYEPFVFLMNRAYFILTDSGGVQEEAPALGKPVLVMREVTERVEAVESGNVKLVGTDCDCIVSSTERLLVDRSLYETMAHARNPYGDGHAAERIVTILNELYENNVTRVGLRNDN